MKKLNDKISKFIEERDWDKFHNPKNLILALTSEVGELADIVCWLNEEQTELKNLDEDTLNLIKEEIADIFYYVLRISNKLDIDLEDALLKKIKINERKYPIALSKGNNTKYNRR
jgi:dCTP diphosphatase